jgi:hypothetical protein
VQNDSAEIDSAVNQITRGVRRARRRFPDRSERIDRMLPISKKNFLRSALTTTYKKDW